LSVDQPILGEPVGAEEQADHLLPGEVEPFESNAQPRDEASVNGALVQRVLVAQFSKRLGWRLAFHGALGNLGFDALLGINHSASGHSGRKAWLNSGQAGSDYGVATRGLLGAIIHGAGQAVLKSFVLEASFLRYAVARPGLEAPARVSNDEGNIGSGFELIARAPLLRGSADVPSRKVPVAAEGQIVIGLGTMESLQVVPQLVKVVMGRVEAGAFLG
jgi:hypothetical protein